METQQPIRHSPAELLLKILSVERLLIANVSWAVAPSMAKPRIRVGGLAHGHSLGDTYPQYTTGRMAQASELQKMFRRYQRLAHVSRTESVHREGEGKGSLNRDCAKTQRASLSTHYIQCSIQEPIIQIAQGTPGLTFQARTLPLGLTSKSFFLSTAPDPLQARVW